MCAFEGHLALAGGNVGASFEDFGRHAGGDRRRSGVKRGGGEGESGCWPSDEDGDGVLELRALLLDERKLRGSRGKQRGLLRNFQAGGDSTFVTVVNQIEALLLNLD